MTLSLENPIIRREIWPWPRSVLVVGLTGSIGSGKSTVGRFMEQSGLVVLNADKLAHRVLHSPGLQGPLVQLLSPGILCNGEVSRKRIAQIVFGDNALREKLNQLIHPAVRAQFYDAVSQLHSGDILVYDVPLLFETGLEKDLDITITVSADNEIRLSRTISRDNTSKEEFFRRDQAQMSQGEKEQKADVVIVNNGTTEELYGVVRKLVQLLKAGKKSEEKP